MKRLTMHDPVHVTRARPTPLRNIDYLTPLAVRLNSRCLVLATVLLDLVFAFLINCYLVTILLVSS